MSDEKPKPTWIDCSQADVAACLGVSTNTVAAWAAKGMPGSKGRYRVPDIVGWLLSDGPWSRKASGDDPLLEDASDSPGLERYRLAKAALAELELEERTKSLLSREKARAVMGRWSSVIRRLGESLGRRFGQEAAMAVNDALDECGYIIENELIDGGNTIDRSTGKRTEVGSNSSQSPHHKND